MFRRALALCLCAALSPAAQAEEAPVVVAVAWPLADMAERLSEGRVAVRFPVPSGTDPAFWRPSIAEIGAIQAADLVLLNGAGFAGWTAKVTLARSRIVDTSRAVSDRFIATETVTHSHGDGGEHSHTGTASHLWLDPDLAAAQGAAIGRALSRLGPVSEDAQATLNSDLDALRIAVARLGRVATAPIIATHPRYQYLARAAGVDIRALDWEAGAAPSDAQLADLKALIADTGATALIWEAAPPEAARAEIRALGLADAVVPTFAQPPATGTFPNVLTDAIDALSDALSP